MKKLFLLLACFICLKASAQIAAVNDTTRITASPTFSPQFIPNIFNSGGVNYRVTYVYNPSTQKYDAVVYSKYLRAFYLSKLDSSHYVTPWQFLHGNNTIGGLWTFSQIVTAPFFYLNGTGNYTAELGSNRAVLAKSGLSIYTADPGLTTYDRNVITYNDGTYNKTVNFAPITTLSGSKTILFPDKSGTVLLNTDTGTTSLPSLYSLEHHAWNFYNGATFHGPSNVNFSGANIFMGNGQIGEIGALEINDTYLDPAKTYGIQNFAGTLQFNRGTEAGFNIDYTNNRLYTYGSRGSGAGIPYALITDIHTIGDTSYVPKHASYFKFEIQPEADSLTNSAANIVVGYPGNFIRGGNINTIVGGGRGITGLPIYPADTTNNAIYGKDSFRSIFGGYDQHIGQHSGTSQTTASGSISSQHARIDSCNHCGSLFGSYQSLGFGSYSTVISATQTYLSGSNSYALGGSLNFNISSNAGGILGGIRDTSLNNIYVGMKEAIDSKVYNTTYGSLSAASHATMLTSIASTISGAVNSSIRNSQYATMSGVNLGLIKGGIGQTMMGTLSSTIDTLSSYGSLIGCNTCTLKGLNAFSGGGATKTIAGTSVFSGGGSSIIFDNSTTATDYSANAGGLTDTIGGAASTRFGLLIGRANHLRGDYSLVGGHNASTGGINNFAFGERVRGNAAGVWVIGDSQSSADFVNSTANSFRARFSGGYDLTGGSTKVLGLITTAMSAGTAGTDSLVVKRTSDNTVRKISPTAYILLNGAGGTPTSMVLTNATGLPTTGLVNSAVTYAKMQAVTTNKLLGSGSGISVQEITLGTGLAFSGTTLNASAVNRAHTIFTPTTGASIILGTGQINIVNPAGTIATLTIALPSSPSNNDIVYLHFTQAVTAITYSVGTVIGAKTAAISGDQWQLTYDTATTSWY